MACRINIGARSGCIGYVQGSSTGRIGYVQDLVQAVSLVYGGLYTARRICIGSSIQAPSKMFQ
eukprot:3430361-Pyramimonas_sp.AAC.1